MSVPRMRLIKEAVAELKEMDPKTKITVHALRGLVIDGIIPCVNIGNRRLVNMDIVEDYLRNPDKYKNDQNEIGTIRRIS